MEPLTFWWRSRRVAHRFVGGALAVAVTTVGLVACGGDPTAAYCGEVKSQQTQLTQVLGDGGEAALLDALPIFRRLQSKAPDDVAKDWTRLVSSLTGLQRALTAAHVDPKTYDAKKPPADVTAAQQQAIAAAATKLGSSATATALSAVQQQARDVCHTPLTL